MRISDWSSDVCSSDLLAVELGVAEEAGTGAVLTVLRGFALAVAVLVTHPAGAAGDVEGDHDPVADGDLGDFGADLFHDAHRFAADDVAGLPDGAERLVEERVRPVGYGRGEPDSEIRRPPDAGSGKPGN